MYPYNVGLECHKSHVDGLYMCGLLHTSYDYDIPSRHMSDMCNNSHMYVLVTNSFVISSRHELICDSTYM